MARTEADGPVDTRAGLSPGQRVEVVSGPLSGLEGDLAALEANRRVELLLQFMAHRGNSPRKVPVQG